MMKTWKVVYYLKHFTNGVSQGVAFVQAESRSAAIFAFQTLYAGQFHTIASCTEL